MGLDGWRSAEEVSTGFFGAERGLMVAFLRQRRDNHFPADRRGSPEKRLAADLGVAGSFHVRNSGRLRRQLSYRAPSYGQTGRRRIRQNGPLGSRGGTRSCSISK